MQLFKYALRVFIKIAIFKRRETLKVATTFYESYAIHFIAILRGIPHASSTLRVIAILFTLPKKRHLLTEILFLIVISSTRSGSACSTAATVLQVPGGGGDGGAGGGPPVAPDGVVPTNNFGPTPTQVDPKQYIRYSDVKGIKLWNAASVTLPAKWAIDSEGISRFNEQVVYREMQSGVNAPGESIVVVPDVDRELTHLVHNYGQLTTKDVSAFV
jgi:hypothetical protein